MSEEILYKGLMIFFMVMTIVSFIASARSSRADSTDDGASCTATGCICFAGWLALAVYLYSASEYAIFGYIIAFLFLAMGAIAGIKPIFSNRKRPSTKRR